MGFRVGGLGFGVEGSGLRVWDLGFGVEGLGFKGLGVYDTLVQGGGPQQMLFALWNHMQRSLRSICRVQGLRSRVGEAGFRV